LFNNHASGITNWQGDGAAGPRGMLILNNTVDMGADARWALQFRSSTGRSVVRNNILTNRNPAAGSLEYGSPDDAAGTDSDDNVAVRVTTGGRRIYSLAEWQAQGGEP